MTLLPYPAYQPSGLPWLGDVPAHWEVRRMKTLLRERTQKGFPNELLLAATQTKGVVRKEQYENRTVLALKDLHLLKLVCVGDFVISLRSFQGGIEFAREHGIISPAYTILYPIESDHHPYLAHLFKSRPFIDNLGLFVTGIRQGQNIDYEKLSRSGLPVPPLPEQRAIARYLAHHDALTRRYLRAKQKMIALLNEQKQTIIHRAVTRGLDPNVKLKPSGVEWLGEVPEHWELWRVGLFAKVGNGSTPSRGNSSYWTSNGYPWLNSSSVNQRYITHTDQFVTEKALKECHLPRVAPFSVLVAITGQGKTRGTAALLGFEATINQHIAYITPTRNIVSPEFLQLSLLGSYKGLRAISDDSGSTKGALTCEDLKHFQIALPPKDEQQSLVATIKSEVADTESAIAQVEREITLLREYRTRLIADVVTGKVDVREAAGLPEGEEGPTTEGLSGLREAGPTGLEEADIENEVDSAPEEVEI